MSKSGLLIGAAVCLLLGVVDLGALNFWLAPQAWPPSPSEDRAQGSIAAVDRPVAAVDGEAPGGDAPEASPSVGLPPSPADTAEPQPAPADEPTAAVQPPEGEALPDAEESLEAEEPSEADEPPPADEPPSADEPPPRVAMVERGTTPAVAEPAGELPDDIVLYFDMGSVDMREGDLRRLRRAVRELKDRSGLRIVVEGHTDNTGTEELNERLGARRATVVARYLERRLGAAAVVETAAYGSTRPADPGDGPKAWAKNRRAVVLFKGGGE